MCSIQRRDHVNSTGVNLCYSFFYLFWMGQKRYYKHVDNNISNIFDVLLLCD